MRIGLIAPPWVPVPPPLYGGIELVVHDLATALTRLGHEVRLFTVAASTCPVDRAWFYEEPAEPMGAALAEAGHVVAAYAALDDVDVIHDHTLIGPLLHREVAGGPPVVVTHHGPFDRQARVLFEAAARTAAVVAISHSQRASAPDLPVAAVIHHGLDLDRHRVGGGSGGYALFVGRMSPDKGLHRAISVARAAGRPLRYVSKMWADDEKAYFEEQVQPLLGDDVQEVRPTSGEELRELVGEAQALLNPIRWREPFGLVMAEALAAGTPVLAFPEGAAVEIVEHGVSGFLCPDEEAMTWALQHVDLIDRQACRRAALARFDHARMAAEHVRLYERVVAGHRRSLGPVSLSGWLPRTSVEAEGTKVPGPPSA